MSPKRLYRELCHYLERKGWTRTAYGDGWWVHRDDRPDDRQDHMFEEAIRVQLERDGIDARDEP
jgi:hypothetical protein